jgi:hypothetical protein
VERHGISAADRFNEYLTDLQNENEKGFGSKARVWTLEKFRKQEIK